MDKKVTYVLLGDLAVDAYRQGKVYEAAQAVHTDPSRLMEFDHATGSITDLLAAFVDMGSAIEVEDPYKLLYFIETLKNNNAEDSTSPADDTEVDDLIRNNVIMQNAINDMKPRLEEYEKALVDIRNFVTVKIGHLSTSIKLDTVNDDRVASDACFRAKVKDLSKKVWK